MEKTSIWEIIAWIGLALLGVWIILKLFGIIESPLIFELAPEIAFFLILGSLLADMKNLKSNVRDVRLDVRNIGGSLVKLGQDFRQLKGEHDVFSKKH